MSTHLREPVIARTGASPEQPLLERLAIVPLVAAGLLLAAIVAVGVTTENFLSAANLRAILASASIVGIAGLGITVAMISGGQVSLATATLASVTAMVFLALLGAGILPAALATLTVGALVYALLGWLIGALAVNPIVLTLAAASVLEGGTVALTGGDQVTPAGGGFERLNGRLLSLPTSVWTFFVLAIALHLVLRKTSLGRRIHLVGDSRLAARAAGMAIGGTVAAAFAIAGAFTALSGMFIGAVNTNAALNVGGSLTFDAIAAVLVGGTAIAGGSGSALRTLVGAIVIATISDVLVLRDYSSGTQTFVKGVLVLLVVVGLQLQARRGTSR